MTILISVRTTMYNYKWTLGWFVGQNLGSGLRCTVFIYVYKVKSLWARRPVHSRMALHNSPYADNVLWTWFESPAGVECLHTKQLSLVYRAPTPASPCLLLRPLPSRLCIWIKPCILFVVISEFAQRQSIQTLCPELKGLLPRTFHTTLKHGHAPRVHGLFMTFHRM